MSKTEVAGPVSAGIYLPVEGSTLAGHIKRGSGIVGTTTEEGTLLLHYEGNLNGAANLIKWSDRVRCAAGRHFLRYPTVARHTLCDGLNLVVRVGSVSAPDPRSRYQVQIDPQMFAAVERYAGESIEHVVSYEVQIDTVAEPIRGDAKTMGMGFNRLLGLGFDDESEFAPWLAYASHAIGLGQSSSLRVGQTVRMLINGQTVAKGAIGSKDESSRMTDAVRQRFLGLPETQ